MLRGGDDWAGEHFAFDHGRGSNDANGQTFGRAQTNSVDADKTFVTIDHGPDGASATIADSHLLFTAHFARSGNDLVLHGDDNKSFVVQEYFATDERARLLSAEGAALSADIVEALAGPLAPGQYAQASGAQPAQAQAVGRVAAVEGNATILRNGVAITAHVGDAVLKGDVLQTVSGQLGVTFTDGSTLNLTANSRMVVNEFVYQPNGTQNSQLLNLVQGSLTFISGEVAHSGNMKIGTPVATMGIRGTIGGVTTANDGTVHFYVSQSATGAVIIDSTGAIIANVVQDGPLIVVRPVGPLQVIAEEINKTPQQLATELTALQHIISVQSVGQQIIQQFFQQDPNNPNPQSTDKPYTQIQIDLHPAQTNDNGDQTPPSATVTIPDTSTPETPNTPPAPPLVIQVPIPPNLPPVNFGPLNATIDEDTVLNLAGLSVFDSEGNNLTVTLSATHGILTLASVAGLAISGNGTTAISLSGSQAAINAALSGATFTPDHDYFGQAAVTLVTSDGTNPSVSHTTAITVTPVNDAPVAADDTATTAFNTLLIVVAAAGLLANDTDQDVGDTLAVTKINGIDLVPAQPIALDHGILSVAADGSYSFQPTQGFVGTQSFQYTVADGHSGIDTATATINVAAPENGFAGQNLQYHYVFPSLGVDYAGDGAVLNTSAQFTVGNGVEFTNEGFVGYTINVTATAIEIAFQTSVSWSPASFNGFRITDYSDSVASIASAQSSSGNINVTFDANNIYVNWQGHSFSPGNTITISVGFDNSGDPIILDLGAPGILLTSALENPVTFDLNADGIKESIGWTNGEDGILVVDLDHSGAIENGHEVFSPAFGNGGFADALAALRGFDTNSDGVIDARDAGFSNILVWQDTNHDGVSQPGELASLLDHGIQSLDLNATPVSAENNGQQVVAEGQMTLESGANGQYLAVAFQTAPPAEQPAAVIASTSAADTFVFKAGDGADTIKDFSGHSGQGDVIALENFQFGTFAELQQAATITDIGHDGDHTALIDLGGGNTLTLEHINPTELTAADFIFHPHAVTIA